MNQIIEGRQVDIGSRVFLKTKGSSMNSEPGEPLLVTNVSYRGSQGIVEIEVDGYWTFVGYREQIEVTASSRY